MYQLTVLLALVSIVAGTYDDHCNGLECPKYTVINTTKSYEIRHYPSFKWATASSHGKTLDYEEASRENFMKLFRYISGNNEPKEKVEMTAPVLDIIPVTQGPFCAPDFAMHFFVPYELQSNPPKPNNDSDHVSIVQLPEMIVYVASYGGYNSQDKIQQHGKELGEALQRDGLHFDEGKILTAGYDSPFKPFFRHNEVMFLTKDNLFTL